MTEKQALSAASRLSFIMPSAMVAYGCALGDGTVIPVQSTTPPGYPYPPQELWRRLVEVIKTHPDELTHPKLGQILGVEFDEDKMMWYGDKGLRNDFQLSKGSIRNPDAFPFAKISLWQSAPDPSIETRRRDVNFDFNLFERRYLGTSEIYCVKPRFPELEALGYRHDKAASNLPQRPDSNGNMPWIPYKTEIFVGDVEGKQINLDVFPNGCLVGFFYFNHVKF